MSTTIRVSEATRDRLTAIAAAEHRPMTTIVDDAVDALERRRFFRAFNDQYRRLRDDAEEWTSVEEERQTESSTLPDGVLPDSTT